MPRPSASDHLPLTPVVLHILLVLADGERHGYAIAQEVEEASEGGIRMGAGTLYGSLQRMQAAGLIEEAPRGRGARARAGDDERRRYYRATSLGRQALVLETDRLRRIVALARAKRLLAGPEPA